MVAPYQPIPQDFLSFWGYCIPDKVRASGFLFSFLASSSAGWGDPSKIAYKAENVLAWWFLPFSVYLLPIRCQLMKQVFRHTDTTPFLKELQLSGELGELEKGNRK